MNRFIPLFIISGTLMFLLYGFKYCGTYHAILPKEEVPSAHIGIVINILRKETDIYTANGQGRAENISDTNTVVENNHNTDTTTTYNTICDTAADNDIAVQSNVTEPDTEANIETNTDDTADCIETTQSPSDICLSYPSDLVAAINAYRNSYGLAGLSEDSQLNTAAGIRCRELISSMSHTRPDGSSCSTIYAELGIYPYNWGENLAGGHYTASETATAWMDSDGHRANILNSSFSKCGVAHISCSSGYRDYWVILFTD